MNNSSTQGKWEAVLHVSGDLVDSNSGEQRAQLIQYYREEHRMKYDHQLESELEGIKARTALEMEQLRVQTREMYDRESKILSDARDSALTERDRAKSAEKELADKYENLLKE